VQNVSPLRQGWLCLRGQAGKRTAHATAGGCRFQAAGPSGSQGWQRARGRRSWSAVARRQARPRHGVLHPAACWHPTWRSRPIHQTGKRLHCSLHLAPKRSDW